MELNALNIFLINEVYRDMQEAEEVVENEDNLEGPIEAPYRNPIEELSEEGFVRRYRVSKDLARQIIELVTPFMVPPSRSSALTVERRVLVALRFYATGSYQEITGSNIYSDISQPSVSRSIREVSLALNRPEIFNEWIHFPRNLQEMEQLREQFFNKYDFPGICGCIDCTHVAVVRPINDDPNYPEHAYVNRKMYHSINVQLICDDNLKILNINSRFPGSVHDSRIWRESNISGVMEQLYRRNVNNMFFLLGDSGYPLRPWLITPINDAAPGSPEEHFNNAQKSIRSTIERCNGVLKNRFRCLLKDRVLHYRPPVASLIINACAVLHNMCITNNIDLLLEEHEVELDGAQGMHVIENLREPNFAAANADLEAGRTLRQHIVRTRFF